MGNYPQKQLQPAFSAGAELGLSPQLIQYVTVLLIVLSFVLGAFVRKAIAVQKSGGSANGGVVAEVSAPESAVAQPFALPASYPAEGSELDAATLDAVAAVLRAHDLVAVIELSPPQSSGVEGALARALTLRAGLVARGVPTAALRIRARVAPATDLVGIRFEPESIAQEGR